MAHFPDKLRVHVEVEEVRLSIRSAEDKVDEYAFDRHIFEDMIEAIDWTSEHWVGPQELRLKIHVPSSKVTLAIEVAPLVKREIHRIGLSEFNLMLSRYHSQVKGL